MNSFLQTKVWARFKESTGWQAKQYQQFWSLSRILPFAQRLTYFPELPFTASALEMIENYRLRTEPSTFSRFEFLEPWSASAAEQLIKLGLHKSIEEVQPEYRQWIDISGSEEKLLEQMKPKGRYNIKVAKRHHLTTSFTSDPQEVSQFYRLYSFTAKRSQFAGRSEDYFQRLVATLKENQLGEVVIVSKDDQPLSAAIIVYWQGLASYLYGGSGGDRSVMAPYWLHFQVMKRSKEKGCQLYDLLAVAPPEADNNHPYAGITRFKQQFGGTTVRMLGSWDLVHRPLWYKIYLFIEKRRRKIIQ